MLSFDLATTLRALAILAIALPMLACGGLGLWTLLVGAPQERTTARLVALTFSTALVATLLLAAGMLATGVHQLDLRLGAWFSTGAPHPYTFPVALLVDRLTLPFMIFLLLLLGLIGAFSVRYLHREPGYTRFFVLLLLFASGMLLITTAGTIDLLFAGWEFVGLTSALLIGFFQERRAPLRNALRAFATYRACDVALLTAAVLLHVYTHTAVFTEAFGPTAWPRSVATLEPGPATAIALCCVFAALGKSAQVPFSGWLPRAMEGPTPSSAVFYGALSIHAGAYLLLRMEPVLERAPAARATLVVVGLLSAAHGTFVGRVQSDVKSGLAYASMTQVGLILAEIGLGLRFIALAHIVGHACVRTLQLLRAPSALDEQHGIEAGLGHAPTTGGPLARLVPAGPRRWLYRLALERGHHDAALERVFVRPLVGLAFALDLLERRWTALIGGAPPAPTPAPPTLAGEERAAPPAPPPGVAA